MFNEVKRILKSTADETVWRETLSQFEVWTEVDTQGQTLLH